MLLYCTESFIFALTIILFLTGAYCQRNTFEDEDEGRAINIQASCDICTKCIPMRRCRPLRDRPDWRKAGVTCGSGSGPSRLVCCPDRNQGCISPRPPTPRPVTRQTSQRPEVTSRTPETDFVTFRPANYAVCGTSHLNTIQVPYVMGGSNATEGAWPWMAAIRMRSRSGNYSPFCTGFLIDRIHVLSAAHCFHRKQNDLYTVRIGAVNQNEGQEYSIVNIAVPEGYRAGWFYNDIAVLTLNEDVNFPGFNPICLPDESLARTNLDGMGTTVAGWGTDRPNGRPSIILKQLGQIPVVPVRQCDNTFRTKVDDYNRSFPRGINEGFICAGFPEGRRDACGGDSGGPLMYEDRNRWFAVGIVSFGYSCGRPGIPGGYTRITSQLRWIRENLEN